MSLSSFRPGLRYDFSFALADPAHATFKGATPYHWAGSCSVLEGPASRFGPG